MTHHTQYFPLPSQHVPTTYRDIAAVVLHVVIVQNMAPGSASGSMEKQVLTRQNFGIHLVLKYLFLWHRYFGLQNIVQCRLSFGEV